MVYIVYVQVVTGNYVISNYCTSKHEIKILTHYHLTLLMLRKM